MTAAYVCVCVRADIVFYLVCREPAIVIAEWIYTTSRARTTRAVNHNGHLISSRCHITVQIYRVYDYDMYTMYGCIIYAH